MTAFWLGFGLALYSGAVLAQSTQGSGSPSWELIALGAVGLLTTILTTWTVAISTRVRDLEHALLGKYHDKDAINDLLTRIESRLEHFDASMTKMRDEVAAIARRMDRMGVPYEPKP